MGSQSATRTLSLDVLRGIAVTLVLGRHLAPCTDQRYPVLRWFFCVWHRFGWTGVDLFFVLSGFLVSGIIFREYQAHETFRPWCFLARRGFKIYPAFYVTAAIVILVFTICGGCPPPRILIGELLFLQNYVGSFIGVTWSLAIEEHFYILLTLLLFFLCRSRGKDPFTVIPTIFVVVASTSLLMRMLNFKLRDQYLYLTHFIPTHLRLDGLFFGVLLSYLFHFQPDRLRKAYDKMGKLSLILVAACFAPAFIIELEGDYFINTFGLTLLYIGYGLLLLNAIYLFPENFSAALPNIFFRTVAVIGFYSYSIYLWHIIVYEWAPTFIWSNYGIVFSFYPNSIFLLTVAILWGIVFAACIEMPALKLRERLLPTADRPSRASVAPR